MNTHKVYKCNGCDHTDPEHIDDRNPKEILHMNPTYYRDEVDWDVCGELKLDVLATFKKLIERNNETKSSTQV